MTGGAVRGRLLELRQALASARSGRDVLEHKRALVLEELRRRLASAARRRPPIAEALAGATRLVAAARGEIGSPGVDAAVLAQPPAVEVDVGSALLLGVRIPRLALRVAPFRPCYGPGGTSRSLDRAGAAFADLLAQLGPLADDEAAAAALRRGLHATARLLGAVEKIVIPRLEEEIRLVAQGLEEEERDEIARRRRWLAALSDRVEVAADDRQRGQVVDVGAELGDRGHAQAAGA